MSPHHHHLTPEQQEAMAKQLRETLGDEVDANLVAGGEEGLTHDTLFRWLRARKWKLEEAAKDLKAHAQWRKEYVPEGRITEVRFEAWSERLGEGSGRGLRVVCFGWF